MASLWRLGEGRWEPLPRVGRCRAGTLSQRGRVPRPLLGSRIPAAFTAGVGRRLGGHGVVGRCLGAKRRASACTPPSSRNPEGGFSTGAPSRREGSTLGKGPRGDACVRVRAPQGGEPASCSRCRCDPSPPAGSARSREAQVCCWRGREGPSPWPPQPRWWGWGCCPLIPRSPPPGGPPPGSEGPGRRARKDQRQHILTGFMVSPCHPRGTLLLLVTAELLKIAEGQVCCRAWPLRSSRSC